MFYTLLSGMTTSAHAREIFGICQVGALESIMRRWMRCKNRWWSSNSVIFQACFDCTWSTASLWRFHGLHLWLISLLWRQLSLVSTSRVTSFDLFACIRMVWQHLCSLLFLVTLLRWIFSWRTGQRWSFLTRYVTLFVFNVFLGKTSK